jgi:6-phosphogluconolactonase
VSGRRELQIVEDPAAVVADVLRAAALDGRDIVLTGGSTPRRAYEMAADADWSSARVWFTDERCVPPDDPISNYGMTYEALLSRTANPPEVFRMEGELGPESGAAAYEAVVREQLGDEPKFDLLLLGLGPDTHVASLFPGKPAVVEWRRLVAGVPVAGMEPHVPRITLTIPAINSAREIVFLITGADKAAAVERAFGGEPDVNVPASLVRGGHVRVVLDEAAAGRLR